MSFATPNKHRSIGAMKNRSECSRKSLSRSYRPIRSAIAFRHFRTHKVQEESTANEELYDPRDHVSSRSRCEPHTRTLIDATHDRPTTVGRPRGSGNLDRGTIPVFCPTEQAISARPNSDRARFYCAWGCFSDSVSVRSNKWPLPFGKRPLPKRSLRREDAVPSPRTRPRNRSRIAGLPSRRPSASC